MSRWSCPELARHAVAEGICVSISTATVRRWLSEDALKPWQYRSWIFITDPDFAAKAKRVLDLYDRVWDGTPLGGNDYVISADEKTSIQARCRCHPTLPPGKSRTMRVNHDYDRGGAVAYLTAYDVHRAKVFGRCEQTTGIEPFRRLVQQVMTAEPYASADRVFWIVDNGSSHRGQAAIDRLAKQYPNAIMVHTPVHASWLNQIEIYFSIVQRKVVSPNDFTDLDTVILRLARRRQVMTSRSSMSPVVGPRNSVTKWVGWRCDSLPRASPLKVTEGICAAASVTNSLCRRARRHIAAVRPGFDELRIHNWDGATANDGWCGKLV